MLRSCVPWLLKRRRRFAAIDLSVLRWLGVSGRKSSLKAAEALRAASLRRMFTVDDLLVSQRVAAALTSTRARPAFALLLVC